MYCVCDFERCVCVSGFADDGVCAVRATLKGVFVLVGFFDDVVYCVLQERLMYFPTWIDLKGADAVPETVHHCVSLTS